MVPLLLLLLPSPLLSTNSTREPKLGWVLHLTLHLHPRLFHLVSFPNDACTSADGGGDKVRIYKEKH